jgi:hypothetical protein
MKTFFRNLGIGIIAILGIALMSCSEDIWVHDGADGLDGKDGRDGYSTVPKVDPVYSNEGILLGNTTSWYLDIDNSFNYTPGDLFQESFTLLNGKDGLNGIDGQDGKDGLNASMSMKLLPPTPECPNGSFLLESYQGGLLDGSLIICIPQGVPGYSLVPEYIDVVFNNGDGDVFGTETKFYWDVDRDGKVSVGDEYKGGFISWNGTDGEDGQDGKDGLNGIDGMTPTITFEVVEGFLIIVSKVDGVIVDEVTFEIPKDGQDGSNGSNGTTPSLHAIKFISHWECSGESGIMYIWYFDLNGNGIDEPDEVVSQFVLCGCDCKSESNDFTSAPCIQDNFNNPDNSHHYWNEGYLFEEGLISINGIGSPEGNGTVVLHKYGENWAEFYTPEFSPSAITSVELDVGSRSTWKVELLFIRANGSAVVITGKVLDGKSDVVWYDNNSYGKPFNYYCSLDHILTKFHDVVRVGFRIHKYGEWTVLDRNHTFNGDNLRVSRVKVLN